MHYSKKILNIVKKKSKKGQKSTHNICTTVGYVIRNNGGKVLHERSNRTSELAHGGNNFRAWY